MNYAIILIAGDGERLDKTTPKQIIEVNGKPLFSYALETFEKHHSIDNIIVVTRKDIIDYVYSYISSHGYKKVMSVIEGGSSRTRSSTLAINYLKEHACDDDNVLIHDGCRPLLSEKIITNCLEKLLDYNAVEVAVKLNDTINKVVNNEVISPLSRDNIYCVQTPQCFKYHTIRSAYLKIDDKDYTDDAQIVKKYLDEKICIVEGEMRNFKITSKEDLNLFAQIVGEKYE